MKQRVVLLSLAAFASTLLACLGVAKDVYAAACQNVANYGAVDMMLPTLPDAESHILWIRMQSPNSTAKVLVEVNQTECLEVSGNNLTPNQWSWQSYEQRGAGWPITFPNNEGNKLRIIGTQSGVKVDRVLVTRADCVPLEFGDNCVDAAEAMNVANKNDEIVSLDPPTNDEVSGLIVLSTTPDQYARELKNVTYSVQGAVLQTKETNAPFDTTLLGDGKHTVVITTTLNDGTVIREQTVINVDNNENAFGVVSRWIRLHKGTVQTIATALGLLLLVMLLFYLLRRWLIRHRQRTFHGL